MRPLRRAAARRGPGEQEQPVSVAPNAPTRHGRARWPRAVLATLLATTACARQHYHLRADGGYQASAAKHDGGLTGTVAAGVQASTERVRIAAEATLAARPAATAALLSVEADLLGLWEVRRYAEGAGGDFTIDATEGLGLTTRVSAGPAFGEHRAAIEAALGVAYFQRERITDVRPEHRPRTQMFWLLGAEVFATRIDAIGPAGRADWMIGGRLSWTIPINFLDAVITYRGAHPARPPARQTP